MTATNLSDRTLLQALNNRRLNGREPLQCNACGQQVHEGDTVVVRLHHDSNDKVWLTTGRFCARCGPETTQGPKPFAAEVVVRGQVGSESESQSQEYFPILLSPEIVDRA